jgi:hypothetical protein
VVLDFDHVMGTKVNSISQMIRDGTTLERLQAEMAKCVICCANCDRRKTAAERKSYRVTPWFYGENAAPMPGAQESLWDGRGSNPRQTA